MGPGAWWLDDEERRLVYLILTVYRLLFFAVLVVGSPWWILRIATSGRYRAGLRGRLGFVPQGLRAGLKAQGAGPRVWIHAVSVGEVLAASAVVRELRVAGFGVAVSTTTETGQALARERFAGCPVFYLPLDFAWMMRRYLRVIGPRLVVTMESELWPNLIHACHRQGIPLAVVNARVSDRSFPRYMGLRGVWSPLLREVSLFLAQGEETAERLRAMGISPEHVRVTGNLKYDVTASLANEMAGKIKALASGRPILVAGSTLGSEDGSLSEDEMLIQAWVGALRAAGVLLVLAPRHPRRFAEVLEAASKFRVQMGSALADGAPMTIPAFTEEVRCPTEIVVLDTIGDLASVYGVADIAFVGGSLVAKGGHNPLEPARFGVPMVMGASFFNFKEIVGAMLADDAVRIVQTDELGPTLAEMLRDGRAMGERGRRVFEAQAGATQRTMAELLALVEGGR